MTKSDGSVDYVVMREHQGDRWYSAGEKRKARPVEVKHLVKLGVLLTPEDAKAAKKASDKRAPAAKNKKA